jgi:hypothetical protein
MSSRVRSSEVGPSPPVTITKSARARASRTAWVICGPVSGTATCRLTTQPRSASLRQSHCWCVLSTRPSINSLPVLMSSTTMLTSKHQTSKPQTSRKFEAREGRVSVSRIFSVGAEWPIAIPPEPPDYDWKCDGNPEGDAQSEAYQQALFAKEDEALSRLLNSRGGGSGNRAYLVLVSVPSADTIALVRCVFGGAQSERN